MKAAIERQYGDVLRHAGMTADLPPALPAEAQPGLYKAQACGLALMQALAQSRQGGAQPLCGAHRVALAAAMPHGVVARALRAMRIDAEALADAARVEAAQAAALD